MVSNEEEEQVVVVSNGRDGVETLRGVCDWYGACELCRGGETWLVSVILLNFF